MQTASKRMAIDPQDIDAILDQIAARRGVRRLTSARRCIISGRPFAMALDEEGAIHSLYVEE